jgi:hypothetical protein
MANKIADVNKKKEFYLIAFKENLILKNHFKQIISDSVYRWNNAREMQIEAWIDKNTPYNSPVSSDLFTDLPEKALWTLISIFISCVILINVILSLIKTRGMKRVQ